MEGASVMKLDNITHTILQLTSKLIGTRTFFVSIIDDDTYKIVKVLNNEGSNISEGTEFPFQQTL